MNPPKIDLTQTALVLIDLQKGIVGRELAPYSGSSVVANAAKLADVFRKAKAPVVLVNVAFSPDFGDAVKVKVDEQAKMPAMAPDWMEIVAELNPQPSDLRITKRQWGAFYGTELDLQLRRRGVRRIVLAGIATHIGVESTARAGNEHGYAQVFVEDAMSSMTAETHDFSVKNILPRLGLVRSTEEVLAGCAGEMKWDGKLALVLVAGTALAFVFHVLHLPASWLFGPLVVSAIAAVKGWEAVQFPREVYLMGQAVIGTALGGGFSPHTLGVLPQHLGIFSFAVVFILLTSLLNGWLLARFTKLNAATAFLGTMPGGAGVMAAMSDSLGADTRLVTAVQYTRLLIILGSLACFGAVMKEHAHAIVDTAPTVLPPPSGFVAWKFGVLVLLASCGWAAGRWTRIPAGTFLVPTLLYFGLRSFAITPGTWPLPVLAGAYLIMGTQIGGRFHPSTVALIRAVILPVIGTTVLLLGASLALAWIVTREMGIGFASAYLAATPGGLDSVAAVATELRIDTTIVVSMHLMRLLCVLIAGPWIVRGCVRWFDRKPVLASMAA